MKKLISLCLALVMMLMLCSCGEKEQPSVEQLKLICELSTVEAYYNDVAKGTKTAGGNWWNVLEKDRTFWIEYEGVVEIGIDLNEVTMDVRGDVISITLPKAKVLDVRIVREKFDESCFIRNKDSWLDKNKITTEEQKTAVNKAQATMVETAMANTALFERAERIAKEAIENYIDKIGEAAEIEFTIEWHEAA